jgi:hypothetical protein
MRDLTATILSGERPPYFQARREWVADGLLRDGLAETIDREMEAGSWAIISGAAGGRLKQTLYDRGFGWLDGRIGFFADVSPRPVEGATATFDDRGMLIPGISRDEAMDVARAHGDGSVLFGAHGRYTSVETTDRHFGRDCGWADVRPAFPTVADWASAKAAIADQPQWRFASPKRRVGRAYEYLFRPARSGRALLPPTHLFYLRAAGARYREPSGLVSWANGTPQDLLGLDAWLPLTAIGA